MSSFDYDPEQWYQKYVVHQDCKRADPETGFKGWCAVMDSFYASCPVIETSKEMEFGKMIGDRLASDPTFMPHIQRRATFEHELECDFGKIPLIGYIDAFEMQHLEVIKAQAHAFLEEYKTGKRPWDQKRADTHGQIDFYLLCLWMIEKLHPENVSCRIHWMPTRDNGDFSISFVDPTLCHTFETKRTMTDILRFGQRINATYKAMQEYTKNHK